MKTQDEMNISFANDIEALKNEVNYTLYNNLLFSATIRTLMDLFLTTEEDIAKFNRRLEINFKLIEKEFLNERKEPEKQPAE